MVVFPDPLAATYIADPELVNRLVNASLVAQVLSSASRTPVLGSRLRTGGRPLRAGSKLRWRLSMTKTAAGSAASTFEISVGTVGSASDPVRLSFTKPAGTAAVDEALVDIVAVVRAATTAGSLVGQFTLIHNLSATGHATVPCVVLNAVSASFDLTPTDQIFDLWLTPGASDNLTIQLVEAEISNFA